jgi:hypothetical protein
MLLALANMHAVDIVVAEHTWQLYRQGGNTALLLLLINKQPSRRRPPRRRRRRRPRQLSPAGRRM